MHPHKLKAPGRPERGRRGDAGRPTPSGPPPLDARLAGPETVEPRAVTVVGNPYREGYPVASPDVFSRDIRDMILYKGWISLGAGDGFNSTGPVTVYSLAPGPRRFRTEYPAPDERVGAFPVFGKRLVVPGHDPKESWAFGNLHVSLGCKSPRRKNLPPATGNILQVIPAPRTL